MVLESKLSMHEVELLKVFKITVERITSEINDIVKQYNKVIE